MAVKKKVKELTKLGYDDDIIAIVLDISEQQVKMLKEDCNSELDVWKKNYYEIYNASNTKINISGVTKEQLLELNEDLKIVKEKINEAIKKNKYIGYNERNSLHPKVNKLKKYSKLNLPLEVIEKIIDIFPEAKEKGFNSKVEALYKLKYVQTIYNRINDDTFLDELNELLLKLNKVSVEDVYLVERVRDKIKKELNKRKNKDENISDEIRRIAKKICSNEYDENEVNDLIEKETEKIFNQKKNKIENSNLTEHLKKMKMPTIQGIKKKVVVNIGNAIKEGEVIYNINEIYSRLLKINNNKNISSDIIISNLIETEHYDDAFKFVDEYVETSNSFYAKTLYNNKINSAKISKQIMNAIKSSSLSIQEDNKFCKKIKADIQKLQISPVSIYLGKNKKGTRDIYLKDIMVREINKYKLLA